MANLLVNADQWNSISIEEQQKIVTGLRTVGSLKAEDNIVGDATTDPYDPDQRITLEWNPIKDVCKIACDVAAGTAAAWCTANTVGVGFALCITAAELARNKCRDSC